MPYGAQVSAPGTRLWVPAHPTAPHATARQPGTPAGSAEGAGAEIVLFVWEALKNHGDEGHIST